MRRFFEETNPDSKIGGTVIRSRWVTIDEDVVIKNNRNFIDDFVYVDEDVK